MGQALGRGAPLPERPAQGAQAEVAGVGEAVLLAKGQHPSGDRFGLDRIALASHLRAQQAEVIIVPSTEALVAGLREGRFEAGATEKLLADQIAARQRWAAIWLPGDLPRYPVAFGLWKGDLTLKRAVAGELDRLVRDGTLAAIVAKYVGGDPSP